MENINNERIHNLIIALEEENEMIKSRHQKLEDDVEYTLTISYLKALESNSKFNEDIEIVDYPLLEYAVNDLETLLSDYSC